MSIFLVKISEKYALIRNMEYFTPYILAISEFKMAAIHHYHISRLCYYHSFYMGYNLDFKLQPYVSRVKQSIECEIRVIDIQQPSWNSIWLPSAMNTYHVYVNISASICDRTWISSYNHMFSGSSNPLNVKLCKHLCLLAIK